MRDNLATRYLDGSPVAGHQVDRVRGHPLDGAEDATADSLADAVRRRDELDSGRVQTISADEFWAAIERERASWK